MPMSCASMAAQVQALCGRTGDTELVCLTQIAKWFNEAQRDIVNRCPGLHAMTFKNTTSLDTTQSLRYSLNDITGGDYTEQVISDVWGVSYLDGQDSRKLSFVHTDEFDAQWPDPTHADSVFGKPRHWTRRAKNIEIRPVSACSYCDKDLRFDGDFHAREFTTADTTRYSDLSQADEGLSNYALCKAWRSIGDTRKAMDYSVQYEAWLTQYQADNDRLDSWGGGMYEDDIE